ncbi:MAG TPA: glycosyltransferase family 4 protein [Flavisolibacter sp.]|nr:glycosyltransferase family 4 protein [Flavisolibacter sp.]
MNTSQKTKVLILAEHFAPAYKAGGIVRCLENLVVLLEHRFSFFVLTTNHNLNKGELLEDIVHDRWLPFTNGCMAFYASAKQRRLRTIRNILHEVQPDIVYINGLYAPFFTLIPLLLFKCLKKRPIVILAPWGMLHSGSLSIKPLKKRFYLKLFKLAGLSKGIRWHATNEQEKNDIHRWLGNAANVAIADAVPDSTEIAFVPIKKTKEMFRLITVSLVTPNKGHLRIINALTELQEEIQAEYHIYGPLKDALFWQTCLTKINNLKSSVKVVYHGFLNPSDLISALQDCHIFVLHSDGENFCQAIYEALMAGRPVITSDQTPWNELQEAKAGWNVKLHDSAGLKEAIKEAYSMNQALYDEFCLCAQHKAKDFISNLNLEKQYDILFSYKVSAYSIYQNISENNLQPSYPMKTV